MHTEYFKKKKIKKKINRGKNTFYKVYKVMNKRLWNSKKTLLVL